MHDHVFVRLNGYGATMLPHGPFRISRASDHDSLLMIRVVSRERSVDFGSGVPQSIPTIADIAGDGMRGFWHLETSVFIAPWPDGFTLVSSDNTSSAGGFDLIGPGDSLLYVQGPFVRDRITALEALAAPGERVIANGERWIRFAYERDDEQWQHAYFVVPVGEHVLLVTGQAREPFGDETFAAAQQFAAGMRANS